MLYTGRFFLALLLGFSVLTASAEANFDSFDWQLRKQANDITIYTAKTPDSKFVSVLAKTSAKTSLSSLMALLLDAPVCPEWVHLCQKSYIHKYISDTKFYIYTATNPPWPVKNRDVLVRVEVSQDQTTQALTVKSFATSDVYPKQKGYLRIEQSTSIWKFTPMKDGQVQIEVYSHIDPAGGIPGWLNNRLIVKTPYISLKNMRALVESGRYDDQKLPYIQEP